MSKQSGYNSGLAFLVVVIFAGGFTLGSWRFQQINRLLSTAGEAKDLNQEEVVVVTPPELVNGSLGFLVKQSGQPYYFKVLSKELVKIEPGDLILVSGKVKKAQSESDKAKSFSDYERSQMIAGEVGLTDWQLAGLAPWYNFRHFVFKAQKYLYSLADQLLPYPHNILTLGVLVGRNDFPADLKLWFRVAGLSHIAVLSGFNLSIVVNSLYAIYIGRFRSIKAIVGLLSAVILAAISGFGASSLRALVMVFILIYAKLTGRTYLAFRALLFTVVVLSLWRPLMLVSDIGFQLSVLATIGLIWLAPMITARLAQNRRLTGVGELIGGTLAAEIMVIPWLSLKFGQVATYGLLANVLVLPAVPILMVLGFVLLMVGSISLLLAYPISFITYFVSAYIITVAELINQLPLAQISFSVTIFWVLGWYLAVALYLIYKFNQGKFAL